MRMVAKYVVPRQGHMPCSQSVYAYPLLPASDRDLPWSRYIFGTCRAPPVGRTGRHRARSRRVDDLPSTRIVGLLPIVHHPFEVAHTSPPQWAGDPSLIVEAWRAVHEPRARPVLVAPPRLRAESWPVTAQGDASGIGDSASSIG